MRHIVLTHLDFDHAGGLPDFPEAKVHVHAKEKDAALARVTFNQKQRYRSVQFAHGPAWETYEALGEPWKGVPAVRQLEGLRRTSLPCRCLAIRAATRRSRSIPDTGGSYTPATRISTAA